LSERKEEKGRERKKKRCCDMGGDLSVLLKRGVN
jgi:hypothetical protein